MHGNPRQDILFAYLAGIIDGEGCIRIGRANNIKKRTNPAYAAYVQVGMTDKRVPELLQDTFGGSLREECVPEKRSIWRWVACCDFRGRCVSIL